MKRPASVAGSLALLLLLPPYVFWDDANTIFFMSSLGSPHLNFPLTLEVQLGGPKPGVPSRRAAPRAGPSWT